LREQSTPCEHGRYFFSPLAGRFITVVSPPLFERSQKAAARPASAISVAMIGTHADTLQLSTKYQIAKSSRNGTTMIAATHSWLRIAAGS